MQLFEDQSGVKSEEEIRRLFLNYFLSLLAVARTPSLFHLFQNIFS
jgi:hypothetical protein